MKRINIGDLVEVDFDYEWETSFDNIRNKVYLVVDESSTCYFLMRGNAPVRSVSKKKCRSHSVCR